MKNWIFVWMLAAMTVVAGAQAVTLSNTTLNATTSNTRMTFSALPVYADLVTVNASWIALQNVSWVNGIVTVNNSGLINYSSANSTIDSGAFLYTTGSSSNVKYLQTNLTSTWNATLVVSTSGIIPSSPLLVHPDGSSEYPSYLYASGVMTFNASIQPGTNTLYLVTSAPCDNSNNLGEGLSQVPGAASVASYAIILLLVVGAGVFALNKGAIDFTQLLILCLGFTVLMTMMYLFASAGAGVVNNLQVASGCV